MGASTKELPRIGSLIFSPRQNIPDIKYSFNINVVSESPLPDLGKLKCVLYC